MRSRGESSLRIVSEEQAQALASAVLDCGTEPGRPHRTEWLTARVSAILSADVVLLTIADGHWTIVTAAPADHPFTSSDTLDLFDDLTAGLAAVRTAGGQDWTLLTSGRDSGGVALAIAGTSLVYAQHNSGDFQRGQRWRPSAAIRSWADRHR